MDCPCRGAANVFDNLGTVETDPAAFLKHRVDGIKAFNFALGVVFWFGYIVHLQYYTLLGYPSPKGIDSQPLRISVINQSPHSGNFMTNALLATHCSYSILLYAFYLSTGG